MRERHPGEEEEEGRQRKEMEPGQFGVRLELERREVRYVGLRTRPETEALFVCCAEEFQLDSQVVGDLVSSFRGQG